jgi:hypothetical protein
VKIQTFSRQSDSSEIATALIRDGGVIVEKQAEPDLVDRAVSELRPHFDEVGHEIQNDFNLLGFNSPPLGAHLLLRDAKRVNST